MNIDEPSIGRLLRLSSILAPSGPIPISKSAWWEGVRAKRFPQPLKLGPRTTVWRAEDIREFIAGPDTWQVAVEDSGKIEPKMSDEGNALAGLQSMSARDRR